ncbi:MAG: signal peptidase I [Prevotellaceae bacterium]|jgi:signal peptidase I|nr:signal peptidase I [Prevotellaceae bacterium]
MDSIKNLRPKWTWKSLLKTVFFWFKIVILGLLLALVLRLFVFSSFKVPTSSMEPAILAGDYILVNKLAYGARLPKNFNFMKGGEFETFRVKGFSKIKRNDVVVFNFPYPDWYGIGWDLSLYYVKRCVALPGDTFYIDKGIYKVKNCSDVLGNYEAQRRFSKVRTEEIPPEIFHCFPNNEDYHWTVKLFGPLYVPRKGDTLAIDPKNIALYRNLIRYETNKEIYLKNDTVYLDNEFLQSYIFQQNYYFMAGDWVSDSKDSRYWGLLPEDHIVGKAAIIWKSKKIETDRYRWKRFFKKIK